MNARAVHAFASQFGNPHIQLNCNTIRYHKCCPFPATLPSQRANGFTDIDCAPRRRGGFLPTARQKQEGTLGKEQAIGDSRAQSLANHGNHERRHGWAWALAGTAILSILLAGCGAPTPKATLSQTGEYFAESEYGVKASPRIASVTTSEIPRGGGRYKLGKPYQVKGRWYKPADDPDYVAEGKASWYGAAFHGRLTANGACSRRSVRRRGEPGAFPAAFSSPPLPARSSLHRPRVTLASK